MAGLKKTLMLSFLLLLIVSCTKTIMIKDPVLPKVSMSQISSVAIRSSAKKREVYDISTSSRDSLVAERIKKMRQNRHDSHKDNSAVVFTSKLEADIAGEILKSDVYDLVKITRNQDPDLKPDATIRLVLNEYKIDDEFTENPNLSSSSRISNGKWNRKCLINLSYELVRLRDNKVLALKNFNETAESVVDFNGYLKDETTLADIILRRIKETVLADILPQNNFWNVSLKADEENEAIVLGNKKANSNDYLTAIDIFRNEFKTTHNVAGGINTALLQFYTGRRERAMETIDEVIQITGDSEAKRIKERFCSIIDNERLVKMIGKNKIY